MLIYIFENRRIINWLIIINNEGEKMLTIIKIIYSTPRLSFRFYNKRLLYEFLFS